VNQAGLCAGLPDDAGPDASYLFLPDTGVPDAGQAVDAAKSEGGK
jgi:hypothetical protein